MDTTPFQNRRRHLLQTMAEAGGGIAVIPTAPEHIRNRDAHYPYRFDSYFHYLSGFPEPEAVLVLIAGAEPRSILFCREKDQEREIWDGFRHGPEGAKVAFAMSEAHPIGELDAKLAELLADQPALWFSYGTEMPWDRRIAKALNAVRAQARTGKRAPSVIRDIRATLDAMRLVKDDSEIALMRQASDITAAAHVRAMQFTAPGRYEYEIGAEVEHEFHRRGCQSVAYGSIVASGANACVLHYVENRRQVQSGDLILIDAGGEFSGYASDITRTFPADGRFTGPQADVYDLVLDAQTAAIAAVKSGASFMAYHEAAVKVLAQGMIDLKLLEGSLDGVIESEAYKRFYMHRTGHWLGMDVHDAGDYRHGEQWTPLAPGMVLTVEPGCYIRPADDVPQAFWNIGVRIEDDVLVTVAGNDVITAAAPKKIADIEAVMKR